MIFFLTITSCNLAPGSYPYAEEYHINVSESVLIKTIEDFKKDNPKYVLPEQVDLQDGRNGDNDHWYHIYFYFPEENQIVYTWTRPSEKGKTTFAFVSINKGLILGNWKEINKDFNQIDNNEQKKKFEDRIFNKIKEKL